jgi:HCOMODA/2-hydroxy-3-carboxy-muconic semialdehyde decarboxylase
VFAAVYMELNARLQMQAAALGPVRYLSEGEVRLARTMLLGPLATERAWTFWRRRVEG